MAPLTGARCYEERTTSCALVLLGDGENLAGADGNEDRNTFWHWLSPMCTML